MSVAERLIARYFQDAAEERVVTGLDAPPRAPAEPSTGWLELARQHRVALRHELTPSRLNELARAAATFFGRRLVVENQFIDLAGPNDPDLAAVFREHLADVSAALDSELSWTEVEAMLRAAFETHRARLSDFVRSRQPAPSPPAVESSAAEVPVICHEYTPELQLRVLGIAADELMDPILDLGCGEHGLLVAFLRELGHEAVGVDPLVAPGIAHCRAASWFDERVESGVWGTILSHQAFGLHFLHAHLKGAAAARPFAVTYRQLLDGLRPFGTLRYAPGLPFVEEHLPSGYNIERRPIPFELGPPPQAFEPVYGPAGLFATAITRTR